jgi:hypothetical protein
MEQKKPMMYFKLLPETCFPEQPYDNLLRFEGQWLKNKSLKGCPAVSGIKGNFEIEKGGRETPYLLVFWGTQQSKTVWFQRTKNFFNSHNVKKVKLENGESALDFLSSPGFRDLMIGFSRP